MSVEELRTALNENIEKAELSAAINLIKENLEPSSFLSQEFTLIKNFASRINYDKLHGLKSSSELSIEENKLVKKILDFITKIRSVDLKLDHSGNLRIFKAIGTFQEMRVPEFGDDFKSKHLLDNFNYLDIGQFSVEYYKLIIEIDKNTISITGEQNIKFRKNKITGEEKTLHNFVNGEGVIQGEYAYVGFYNTQIEGLAIHRGNMILNISDMKHIYGYLMTPDIELPGIIAIGRVEMKVVDE